MIALQENWAGLIDFVVELTTGGFGAFDVVVNFYAVEREGDFVSDDGGLGGLPLVSGLGDKFIRGFEIIDGAIAIDGCLAASVIAEDLDFMTAPQIKPAVGFVGNHEFEFDGEIPKFVVGDEIVAVKIFIGGILKHAILDRPTVAAIGMAEMPTGGVFAVKDRAESLFVSGENAQGGGE